MTIAGNTDALDVPLSLEDVTGLEPEMVKMMYDKVRADRLDLRDQREGLFSDIAGLEARVDGLTKDLAARDKLALQALAYIVGGSNV